jgi:hypothetical protein
MREWLRLVFEWWWNDTFLAQVDAFTGIVSLVIGTAIGLLAWRISMRQMVMQAEQHKFFEEQLAKKTDLRVIVQGVTNSFGNTMGSGAEIQEHTTIRFHVHNGGNKSADGFYWEILVPEAIAHWFTFINGEGEEVDSKISHQSATEHYRKIDGHYTQKLWGFTGLQVARLSFLTTLPMLAGFTVKWRIRGEDGMVPPEGLAFIKLKRIEDGTYVWSSWHEGQKEFEIQGIPQLQ